MDVTSLIGQMGFLNFVFSFLLVFALLYAVFSKTKIPSDKNDLNALIAFVLAFLVSMSPMFSGLLLAYTPFVAFVFVLIALGFVIFGFFGAKPEMALKSSALVYGIIILLIIGLFAYVGMMMQQPLPQSPVGVTGNSSVSNSSAVNASAAAATYNMCNNYSNLVGFQAVQCMFGDPVFLGMLITLVIMAVAVYLLVVPPKK